MNDLQKAARQKAVSDQALFNRAHKQYGGITQKYLGAVPKILSVAHVMEVNPTLSVTLPPDKFYRKGFCRASIQEARFLNIKDTDLDDPDTSAYVWGYELNKRSISLYTEKSSYFTSPGEDFWKTLYLKYRIGDSGFNKIWNSANLVDEKVYDSLLTAITTISSGIIPWSFIELNHLVFYRCEYVCALATRHSQLRSEFFGQTPALNGSKALDIALS